MQNCVCVSKSTSHDSTDHEPVFCIQRPLHSGATPLITAGDIFALIISNVDAFMYSFAVSAPSLTVFCCTAETKKVVSEVITRIILSDPEIINKHIVFTSTGFRGGKRCVRVLF